MRWLLFLILSPILLLVGLVLVATDSSPALKRPARVGMADLERGKALVDVLGLRRMGEGETRQIVLSEADLDQGLNYLAARLVRGSAGANIALSRLTVRASLPLRDIHRHLNLTLALAPGGNVLVPVGLRAGGLSLPAPLADALIAWALAHSPYSLELAVARGMLDSAVLSDQTLMMRFTWRQAAVEGILARNTGRGAAGAMLDAYRSRLRKVGSRDLATLLGEAFVLAKSRSAGRDPVAENRAALIALAEFTLGGRLISAWGMAIPSKHTGIRLAGREDYAQHFAFSAFIAATGGQGLSDLAGLYKELKDAQGGSGFSFTDLAANRAGSRLGELSTRSPASARRVQDRLAGTRNARAYLPAIRDLPEFMGQSEFQRRFGGPDQPAYRRTVEEIEARIAGLTLYRD